MSINLWLDDHRPVPNIESGRIWTLAKTADEAIAILKTGLVKFASLDHDLADEHYQAYDPKNQKYLEFKEKTGYDVICYMEEFNIWPEEGVRIHTMNVVRKPVMLSIVQKIYGRTFQDQYVGQHRV